MKLPVLAAAALVGFAAFSTTVETANTFGVMKVSCSAQKVIVCTPWVAAVTAGDVPLTNMVMTTGLSEGDAIILYANGSFKSWKIGSDGKWAGVAVTGVGGTVTAGDAETIARGAGFWFVKNSFESGNTYDLYLYGQDTSADATSTVTANAYNLIANPKTSDVDIVGKITPATGDSVQIPGGKLYKYNGTNWTTTSTKTVNSRTVVTTAEATSISIPAGTGCWYVSKGGSGTISW